MSNLTNTNSDNVSMSQSTSDTASLNSNASVTDAVLISATKVSTDITPPSTDLSLHEQDVSKNRASSLHIEAVALSSSQQKQPFAIANTLSQAIDLDNLYQLTVNQLRKNFSVDRALIYQFQSETQGAVIAESIVHGYTPTLGQTIDALIFGAHTTKQHQQQAIISISDISEEATTPHQIQLCQKFQIQASISLPLFLEDRLWGLMAIQTCSAPRQWTETDVAILHQISTEFVLRLHVHELRLQNQQELIRERMMANIVRNIRNLPDLQPLFKSTVQAIRRYIKTDRVAVFKFHPNSNNGSGEVIAESVDGNFISTKDVHIEDHCFNEGGKTEKDYREGGYWAATNIYEAGLPECHLDLLAQLQVQANLVVPLLKNDQLWGLFCIHHCRGPRAWKDSEIAFIRRVAARLDIALQRTTYLEKLKNQNQQLEKIANQERIISQVTERLRKFTNLSHALKTSVHDIRQLMQVGRVGLFQFDVDSNYSAGEFVVEDVAAGVPSAISKKIKDHCFSEGHAENYRNGRNWIVNDIEELDIPACLQDLLKQMQVKASLVIPLLKGDILWGLFCMHECHGPRVWQKTEIDFARRIGVQLNIALQQADYLEQLQQNNAVLEATAQREKESKERLQKQVTQLLKDVYPALEGDLTVRAPVTDTEVGTVASAYNNTLQSLQEIVLEVKQAADQVGQTSNMSEASVSSLNQRAQQQLAALERAVQRVQEMMDLTKAMSNSAQQVEKAVQQANLTVKAGDTAMNSTVENIIAIRTTVAETSQRIKRLSESSQKISKVVNLISHFTSQTQLLSLNASIEATRAGEFGRGFAVVADEVRSLARQSANAATEIEQLVQEIQIGTAEVSTAMETGIQQVAQGTGLVTETRQNLTAIIESTAQISSLIEGITHTTQQQVSEFQDVTVSVNEATDIASQTSTESEQLAKSIFQLSLTADALQTSADKFKVS